MNYDRTSMPGVYDRARGHPPELLARWVARITPHVDRGSTRMVLDLGCGIGDALAALKPSYGMGVDISGAMVAEASARHPELTFVAADIEDPDFVGSINGPFDYIVVSEAIGLLDDCEQTLRSLHPLCGPDTRIVIAYFSPLWEPILDVAALLKLRMPQFPQNWLSTEMQ